MTRGACPAASCTSTTMQGFRRLEEGRLESRCPEKTAQCCARRSIILDDCHDQRRIRLIHC